MPRSTYIIEIGPSVKPAKMPAPTERYIERMPGEATERRVHWTSGYEDEANYNPSPGPASTAATLPPRAYQTTASYVPVESTTYRDYGTASYGASYPPGAFRSGSSFSQQPRSSYLNTPRTTTMRLSDDDLVASDDQQAAGTGRSGERRRSSRRSREFEETIADLRRQLDTRDVEIDRTKSETREQKRRIQQLEKTMRELEIKLKQADDSAERYLDRYRELLARSST